MRLTTKQLRVGRPRALARRWPSHLPLAATLLALMALVSLRSISTGTAFFAGHKESKTTAPPPPSGPRTIDWLLLLVQGKAEHLYHWQAITAAGVPHVTLIYATYDAAAPGAQLHLPNSTWTQGRNALARAAACEEARRGARAKYWVFADDDVSVLCEKGSGGACWESYFEYLRWRATAPTVALRMENQLLEGYNTDSLWLTDSYDSIINAVRRDDAVPVLLPYVEAGDAQSWWISQSLHFRVMRACFPEMGAVPAEFAYDNPIHREYPRGRDPAVEITAVATAYDPYGGLPSVEAVKEPYDQLQHLSGPHVREEAAEILKRKWEAFKAGRCTALGQRFEEMVVQEAGCGSVG